MIKTRENAGFGFGIVVFWLQEQKSINIMFMWWEIVIKYPLTQWGRRRGK